MRIWSIHPKYLDAKGLVALWRETLLARHVLAGKTRGYRNHPQLDRFKELKFPVEAIDLYLAGVHAEASARGYRFDATKFEPSSRRIEIPVTKGQVKYEFAHLLRKLEQRDPKKLEEIASVKRIQTHPLFAVEEGEVAPWEKR